MQCKESASDRRVGPKQKSYLWQQAVSRRELRNDSVEALWDSVAERCRCILPALIVDAKLAAQREKFRRHFSLRIGGKFQASIAKLPPYTARLPDGQHARITMWFKNLVIYKLPEEWSYSAAQLEDQLQKRPLQPCGAYDMQSRGWVAPGPQERLVHTVNNQHLIALGADQKLLPGSIIKQETLDRAKALAAEQGYPVGRRQMREVRERVTEQLRARALTRRKVTRAWIDTTNGWFIVDAAGAPRAEEVVETLRETLGTFAATLLDTQRSPQAAMAAWLMLGDAPLRLAIDQDLELQTADQTKATVKYTRHPLEIKEIQGHLNSGKFATRLGLTWADRISFVLTDKLHVKRIQFLEVIKESSEGEEQSAEEQFDIDFALMAGELSQLVAELQNALSPEQVARAA